MAPTAGSTSSTDGPQPSAGGAEPGPAAGGATRDPAAAPDGVSLGRVVGAHGVKGELRVRLTGDDRIDLSNVSSVRLAREEDPRGRAYEVAGVRRGRSGECRLALAGVSDRDAALALRGCMVRVRASELPRLPVGEYYAYELVGCAAEDPAGRPLGIVKSIVETGARDALVIEDAAGVRRLVPAVEPLLARVDLGAQRIVLDLPPGLLDEPVAGGRGPCSGST
jgi:16S rRNA processing protein RimM